MLYIIERGTTYVTPHGTVTANPDGHYKLTDEVREYLERFFGVTCVPAQTPPPAAAKTETERRADDVARVALEEQRAAAQAHAQEIQRLPLPEQEKRRKR